jgi:hypothetical protein
MGDTSAEGVRRALTMDIGKLFKDAWGLFVKDIGPLIVGMLIASIIPAVAGAALGLATFGASMNGLEVNDQGTVQGFGAQNWVLLAVGSVALVAVILCLSAPLYAGLLSGVIRRVREGREMGYGDAFSGFHIFGRVVWASILLALVYLGVIAIPVALIVAGAVTGSGVLVAFGVVIILAAMVLYTYLMIAWVYIFPVIVDRDIGAVPSLGESRRLVHGSGWWWTFLVLFILQLAAGAAGAALGMVPFVGSVAMILIYPFMLTYIVAMYFQARGEGGLIDVVLNVPAAPQWTAPPGAPAPPAAAPYAPPPAPPLQTPAGSPWQPDPGVAQEAIAETDAAQPTPPEAPPAPEPPSPGPDA